MPAKSKLALLIAKNEGFGKPGEVPTTHHNPGDLRHTPHSNHPGGPSHANDIGTIDTDEDGWEDLERQLGIFAQRKISTDPATHLPCTPRLMTLHDLAYTYAPPEDNNNTVAYLAALTQGLDLQADTLVSVALRVPA